MKKSVLAIAAHPDDIEFVMAGTLLRLADAGWSVHYMNLANGCCGSMEHDRPTAAAIRLAESQAAAACIPARFHPPICDDIAIEYTQAQLMRVAAVVRSADPSIVLTHSPIDYMEDHQNACRLAVTATFIKNMPNYLTEPRVPAVTGDVAVYHAQPHSNRTPLGEWVQPEWIVDVTLVLDRKIRMLECHASQRGWLDATQGMSSYVQSMIDAGRVVAAKFGSPVRQTEGAVGEGWRRRNPIGFGPEDWDPLREVLGE
jgi:LmbE family N-acetylglucosaminyl deacetylase